MNKVVRVLLVIKNFLFGGDSAAKSRKIRSKVTSIVTGLADANIEIMAEKDKVVENTTKSIEKRVSHINKLNSVINKIEGVIKDKSDASIDKLDVLDDEAKANSALLRGINKLMNGNM
jgi:hypothetical protein